MTDDQDAAGIKPVPADKRPRPALPPGSNLFDPSWHVEPTPAGRLRPIPDLVRATFSLIGRQWRPLGEFAVVGAAGYVVAFVMLFLGLNALFGGQFFSHLNELSDPTGDMPVDFDTWLESFEVTPTTTAITLLVLFMIASLFGFFVQEMATTLAALDDVNGREVSVGAHVATAIRRLPKVLVLSAVMCMAGCGTCVLLALYAGPLSLVWGLAMLAIAPLTAIYFMMTYAQPGLPSPRRWWRLMKGRKAAVWRRIVLLTAATGIIGFAASLVLGVLPLPNLYGDLIANVVVTPLTLGVLAVARLLIYADLISLERHTAVEADQQDRRLD